MIARFDIKPTKSMHLSDAKGSSLLHDGVCFGADIIEFPPNGKVEEHTHPGAHCLFCIGGGGFVFDAGHPHKITVGDCYMIKGGQSHAVHAGGFGLKLIVVGNDHRHVESEDRLVIAK